MASPEHPERIYGLIGFPLQHSFSQDYFNRKFEAESINACYLNFEIPDIGDFMEVVAEHRNLCGLNVTIPYKEQVMRYMNSLDPEAEAIGAVNVIRITYDENDMPSFRGYNSDVIGFTDSIRPLITPEMTSALVLGTGGAAKAVAHGLRKLGIEPLMVSRSHSRPDCITYAELTPDIVASHLVIVNCTPLGMYPHTDECPDIPYQAVTPKHLCYDLLYNPDVTEFMRRCACQGATVKNGLEMLLLQAFESWRIWNERS